MNYFCELEMLRLIVMLRAVGVLVAVGFMIVSVVINWRYGASLGREAADQLIFSAASLLADIAKATTPFFFFLWIGDKRWAPASAAAAFWLACTAYALTSVTGFLETNRAMQSGARATRVDSHAGLTDELKRKQSQREAMGHVAPSKVAAARVESLKQDRRWQSSKNCSEVTGNSARQFCQKMLVFDEERVTAIEAERLDGEMRSLREEIGTLAGLARLADGDPRVAYMSRVTGWPAASIETLLSLLFLAVLELGSGLGLFIALGHGVRVGKGSAGTGSQSVADGRDTPEPVAPGRDTSQPVTNASDCATAAAVTTVNTFGDVAQFARACLAAEPGGAVTIDALFSNYGAWCRREQMQPLSRSDFEDDFAVLADLVGFKFRTGGRAKASLDLVLVGGDEPQPRI